MNIPHISIFPTLQAFEVAAANWIAGKMTAAIETRGECLMALCGGNTPRGAYRRLAELIVGRSIDQNRVHIIFSDERMVPPDNPESNYGMVRQEFISHIPDSSLHVHRISGEVRPDLAATGYDHELQALFPQFGGRCDLVLLGVGEDGHTASLFPGTEILLERAKLASEVFVPHLDRWRVTLTLPVINNARAVLFLATGKKKAGIVSEVCSNAAPRTDLPASLVRPHPGTLTWMLDAEAASKLASEKSSQAGRAMQ